MKKILSLLFIAVALSVSAQKPIPQSTINAVQQAMSNVARPAFTPDNKLRYAERIIENYYVDSVDVDMIVQEAIIAMLKKLDPHSLYSDPEETRELTTPLEGNFSGIGIQFNMLNDTLFVVQTIAGGPCEKVGIKAGDRILQAGDSVISGVKMPNSRVIKILRGPKGTRVDLKVLPGGETTPVDFVVTRDDIPVYSVDAAFMATPTTGYVKIARFGETTYVELKEAISKLKKEGMKDIIIDLQDNGGGYLQAAIDIADIFLPRKSPVVYTESPRSGAHYYSAESNGNFDGGKVVVIVNQNSASASEILAGAIQDNDRGVIVGRRSFGKGLVQRPFPFPDGSMIRLTTSRYHTPSGRCIQRPYDSNDPDAYRNDFINRYESGELLSQDSIHINDSLRYETLNSHRPVYGGGGIMPDIFVPIDTTGITGYYKSLVAKGIINKYVLTYVDKNRDDLKYTYPNIKAFINHFKVQDKMIEELEAMAEKEGIEKNSEQLVESLPLIKIIIKGMVARDIFDMSAYYQVVLPELSEEYKSAVSIINNKADYTTILSKAAEVK